MAFLPFCLLAGERIDKQLEIPLSGSVMIEVPRGEVVIKAWDKPSFKVSGSLDELAKGYTLKTNGGSTEFIVEMPKMYKAWDKGTGANLTIYMPKNNKLSFEGINVDVAVTDLLAGTRVATVNGAIKAAGLSGKVSLETVNGDIEAEKLSGNLQLETVNGNIDDRDSSGKLRLNIVNGDISSDSKADDVRLESVNGEIDLVLDSLSDLRLSTVNGEIDVKMNKLNDNSNMNIETVSGDVSLYFPDNISARFAVNTFAGGKIINKLSKDQVIKAKYGPSSELEFTLNDGQADIEIDTVSGRIELNKK